jgi:N-acetylglucosaminyldiphosphoundecaprenol N-acetyl-beta-D-mannosaminyltransferase
MAQSRVMVLGVGFDNVTMEEAAAKAIELARSGGGYVATPNAEIVYACKKNAEAKAAVNGAALVVPDGIGVVKASKILKRPLKERVPGVELGMALLPAAAQHGLKLFILGGKPGVAEEAAQKLSQKYKGLVIAGTADGYFKNDAEVIEKVNASGADILFVCLGAPKQEIWMQKNRDKLTVSLMLGLGGSVDIYAGKVERAPQFWQKTGLEWFYRMMKQPKRDKRILGSLPPFMLAVYKEKRAERKAAR